MSTSSEKKHYIAFISYSTADEKWAKWLWHKLEYYPIPSNLRREHPHLPKHLRPVFWYKQDLSGTHLEKSLQKELDDSQYLLVICSPSSAQSAWVNKEVERFVQLGRINKIIPFVVQGTPHATNPDEECFPPALRDLPKEQEIRGIDVRRKEGKQHAFIDVVATILNIRFNTLWQRHQRRRKKVILRISVISTILSLILTGLIAYHTPHIEYYADYVDQWGMPVGVVPISKEQKEHRHGTYRFKYQRTPLTEINSLQWRLEEVAYVNASDIVTEHDNLEYVKRSAIMYMQYSELTGVLTQIQFADADGKILYRQDISQFNSVPAAIADFRAAAEDQGAGFAHSDAARMEQYQSIYNSAIKRFAYLRDSNGYHTRITFHSNNDDDLESSKVCDINGIYGTLFQRDSLGRILQVQYIDEHGDITCTKLGVAGYRYTYDNIGSVNSYFFFDMNYKPILNEQQWASSVECTNEYGNTYRGMYYNEEGVLCNAKEGYAQFTYDHDAAGNKTRKAFFDTDTLPCLSNEGIAGWNAKYNDFGWCTERSYFGVDNKPCIHPEHQYARITRKYNLMGKCTEEAYYGADGKPCNNVFGYAKEVNKYDIWNNCIQTSYFDTLGHPGYCLNAFTIKRKFDERQNCIEEAYFDAEGNPCYFGYTPNNTTKWCSTRNSQGLITEHRNYDADGQLNNRTTMLYDARGNTIEIANYDADGNLLELFSCIARITTKYDKQGNEIEVNYYNEENKPFLYEGLFATRKQKYDKQGNVIEKSFHDTKGALICNDKKYAMRKMKYDKRGHCIEKANYNEHQQICIDDLGVAIYQYEYDTRGNKLQETFLNTNYRPMLNKKGYAKACYEYDIRNKQTKATYYNQQGKEININNHENN